MQGEKKIIVLGAMKGKFTAQLSEQNVLFATGHDSWAYTLESDYSNILKVRLNELDKYDIILANLDYIKPQYIDKLVYFSEKRDNKIKWVSLIEGEAGHYIKPDISIKRLLDASDIVVCINKLTLSFFQAMTSTKVVYIGVPYPLETIQTYYIPIEKRQKRTFICSNLLSRCNDYLVAKALSIPYYGFEKRLHRTLKRLPKNLKKYGTLDPNYLINKAKQIYNDTNLIINKDIMINQFFDKYNDFYLWINLDNRYTWGRYVLDAAALQIPIITTKATGHAIDLFPDTCLENEYEIDKAINIGKKLLSDKDFYQHVITYPLDKLDFIKHDSMKTELFNALESIGKQVDDVD